MPKLGVTFNSRSATAPSGAGLSVSQGFLIGYTDKGSATQSVLCESLADFETAFGVRSNTNSLYDDVDAAFQEGLSAVNVSRIVGPSAVNASVTLNDSSGSPTLKVTAVGPGVYANGYEVVVTNQTGTYTITVQDSSGNLLESVSGLTTRQDALDATFGYVSVSATGSSTEPPAPQQISSPSGVTAGTATSGGSLTASSTYYYVVTATNSLGETMGSSEVSQSTTSSNKTIPLSWSQVTGATGYKVYRGTSSGSEVFLTSVSGGSTTSYTDSGSATPGSAVPPTANTTGLQALSGGSDDRADVTDTEIQNALDNFGIDLGGGQLAFPGNTDPSVAALLLNHCAANNRVAVLDIGTGGEAALAARCEAIAALPNASYGLPVAGNLTIPGVAPLTTRTVPASAIAMGLISRGDAATNSPNTAPCGINYPCLYAVATDTDLNDGDRQALFNAGGNTFHVAQGVLSLFGFQTAVPQSTDDVFDQFNHARTRMFIAVNGLQIAQRYQFAGIDGAGMVFTAYKNDLNAMLSQLQSVGALYGTAQNPGYLVDVGPSVNTAQTIANQEIHAVVSCIMSPYASYVELDLVSYPTTSTLS